LIQQGLETVASTTVFDQYGVLVPVSQYRFLKMNLEIDTESVVTAKTAL
jgi:hypothetical protein